MKWIKLSEKQPEKDKDYLGVLVNYNGSRRIAIGPWYESRPWGSSPLSANVTHWMELPELPNEME